MLNRFLLLALFLCIPYLARGQWVSDSTTNTVVCTATNLQDHPAICSDGNDGAIVAWEDLRGDGAYIIYAQRLNAAGQALWASNGIRLTYYVHANQRFPSIVSDDRGGAYVVWQDSRNSSSGLDLYSQHVTSTGGLAYDSLGKPVGMGAGDQTTQHLIADGFGNAYVVWEDNRSTVTENNPDIYMNRLGPSRVMWDTTGVLLCGQSNKQRRPSICEDGVGGFVAAWESFGTNPVSIYSQRVDSNAHLLWTTPYGVNVYQATDGAMNARDVALRRDGSQYMIAWEVSNVSASNGQDVYADRIAMDGSLLFSPIEVTGEYPGDQINPQPYSDDSAETSNSGNSGMIVLFENNFSSYPQSIEAVRTFANGVTRTPTYLQGFYQVSPAATVENSFHAVPLTTGTVLTVWNDARGDSSIYAQSLYRALSLGFHKSGTPPTWGLPICQRTSTQSKQSAVAPRTNGAIIAWTDYRNGNADIYAQLLFKDGTLPVEVEHFQANYTHQGEVTLRWSTASENGNAGFELERRAIGAMGEEAFETVASYATAPALRGAGTSVIERNYAYVDAVGPGLYDYRLVDVALDGTKTTHGQQRVDARWLDTSDWTLGQSYPNPLRTSAALTVSLPVDAIVDIAVTDPSGRTVAMPVAHQTLSAGQHDITIAAGDFPASGSYLVRMTAFDPATGGRLWSSARPGMISVVR